MNICSVWIKWGRKYSFYICYFCFRCCFCFCLLLDIVCSPIVGISHIKWYTRKLKSNNEFYLLYGCGTQTQNMRDAKSHSLAHSFMCAWITNGNNTTCSHAKRHCLIIIIKLSQKTVNNLNKMAHFNMEIFFLFVLFVSNNKILDRKNVE